VVPEIPISEIQSLLESGKTTPLAAKRSFSPRRITTRLFNPLKLFIMITTFAIVITALLTFNAIEHRELIENVGPVESQKNEKPEIVNIQTDKSLKQASTSEPKSLGIPVQYQVKSDGSNLKDTVFKGIILDLSKEELSRLGFMFDDEGYYYLNKLPDGSKMNCWSWQMNQDERVVGSGLNYVEVVTSRRGGSFGFASGGFVNKVNKSALHDFDFYPVLTTDLNGENPYPISQVEAKVRNSFEYMNDTLVPVMFSRAKLGGYNTKDMLVWFKVSDSFFNLLNSEKIEQSRIIYNRARQMAVNQVPANRVMYDYSSTSDFLTLI